MSPRNTWQVDARRAVAQIAADRSIPMSDVAAFLRKTHEGIRQMPMAKDPDFRVREIVEAAMLTLGPAPSATPEDPSSFRHGTS